MHHSDIDLFLYDLTFVLALFMLYLLVRMLLVIKKVDQKLLRARIFLDPNFVARGIRYGTVAILSLIAHIATMYYDAAFWDAFFFLLGMLGMSAIVYDWYRLIRSAVRK